MRHAALLGSLALLLSTACTSRDEAKQGGVEPVERGEKTKKPEPPGEPLAKAAISSVQMIEDCPEDSGAWRPPPPPSPSPAVEQARAPSMTAPAAPPEPEAGAMDMEMAPGAAARMADGGSFQQPCTQSTLQIAFTGQGDVKSKVELEELRLLDPGSGKPVATIDAREPASWEGSAYQSWDETIGPNQEVKSSYELSVPDWSKVEKAIGGKSSYGHMFVLEVDLKVGDQRQTVRSAQFPREEPHVIVT